MIKTYQGTTAAWFTCAYGGINPAGMVTSFFLTENYMYHGFLRDKHGKFITFDVPGSGTSVWQGTMPISVDPEGGDYEFVHRRDRGESFLVDPVNSR